MELSNEKISNYMKRLLKSRLRILVNNGFYGLLLMHMTYAIDENCETASTDGKRIYFGPDFLDELDDSELDFVMMHEILHVVLQHCLRYGDRDKEMFNVACDIVVNSNILLSEGNDIKFITLKKYGESMHITPNGDEGHKYTAEQVYEMLQDGSSSKSSSGNKAAKQGMQGNNSKKQSGDDGEDIEGGGEGVEGGKDGEEGKEGERGGKGSKEKNGWDDHARWGTEKDNEMLKDVWAKRFQDAYEAMKIREACKDRGLVPRFAERLFEELKKPQTDWRQILNEFIQEEIVDYSFSPPDRRYDDNPFFLPDFNEKDEHPEDILFMIDTSGSMSDEMITAAYSEVKGAIDQYDGKLKGWLGYFDAAVIEPQYFENEEEFKVIRPKGGGGTDFKVIFDYIRENMQDKLPVCVIILTDGYAPFGCEEMAMGIPVLWLLNNQEIQPPWGKVARIELDGTKNT